MKILIQDHKKGRKKKSQVRQSSIVSSGPVLTTSSINDSPIAPAALNDNVPTVTGAVELTGADPLTAFQLS